MELKNPYKEVELLKKTLRKPMKKVNRHIVTLYAMEAGTNYGNCNCVAGC